MSAFTARLTNVKTKLCLKYAILCCIMLDYAYFKKIIMLMLEGV